MTIVTGNIPNLLRAGLAAVAGMYPNYPTQWSEIFDTYESDKNFEQEVEMKFLGIAAVKPEGGPSIVDNMGQRFVTTYQHKNISISFAITQEALEDNLYKNYFPMQTKALMKSMNQAKEVLGMSILNLGFDPNAPIGDGQPFFSTAHPIDGGAYANRFAVQADLNEASLEAATIQIMQFPDLAGLRSMVKPRKLVTSIQNTYVGERLLGSSFRTGTANNDISAMYSMGTIPEGGRTMQFLTIPKFWGILTDASDGLKYYERTPLNTDVYTDFITSNLLAKAWQRYSFGVTNPRAMFASTGV